MHLTKLQSALLVALALGAAGALVWQYQTIVGLRRALVAAQAQAAEKRAQPRVQMPQADAVVRAHPQPSPPPPQRENAADSKSATPGVSSMDETIATLSARAGIPRNGRQLVQLHQRYDGFLQGRGLTPAQIDRWIELMMTKENIRMDLRETMIALGVPASQKFEELRTKATDPLWKEMHALLGVGGEAAFSDHESLSYYRMFVGGLTPRLAKANEPLSAAQFDQLTRAIRANDRPRRDNPNDLGSISYIEWAKVAEEARSFLSPTQSAILQDFAARESNR